MEKVILRLFAAVIIILAVTGCTVRCEVEPIFTSALQSLFDDKPVTKKGRKS